jgi:rod shape-determining protein MreD
MTNVRHGHLALALTFLIALLLTIMPLPEWARILRPQWYTLTLIYWCMAMPERVGIFTAFGLGLLVDVLTGTLMGMHALSLSVIAFVTILIHQRTRVAPMYQQMFTVLLLLILEKLLSIWIIGIISTAPSNLSYWASTLTGAFLWPWIYIILRDIRRRFGVH